MKTRLIVGATLAASVSYVPSPSVAQDEEAGLRQRLRIEQNFGFGENLGLEIPSSGSSQLATTRLTYGLNSETRTQRFSFVLGGGLRFGEIGTGSRLETGFVDPLIGLRYAIEGANSSFDFELDARETDISQAGALFSFLDADGAIAPPSDFSSIRGTGKRRTYRFDSNLLLNQYAPISFLLTAGASGTRYVNPTDTSLVDFDRSELGARTIFRLNPASTLSLSLNRERFQSQNALNTDRTTDSTQIGFDTAISARASLSVSAGYTEVETIEGGAITTSSGPSGSLAYTTEMPNGTFNVAFDLTRNSQGELGTLRLTRSLELPLGSFSANIGLANSDSSTTQVIGGLSWLYQRPTSQFSLRLNREVLFDANDEQRFTNEVVAGFRTELNPLSNFSVDVSLFQSEAGLTSNQVDRGDLTIAFERELTSDWSFSTGVDFSFRDEDTVGRADSSSLFFGFGRNFDF
ncbi:MAG: hypothetical protein AB8B51_00625 [Sedimentitalea sp.]